LYLSLDPRPTWYKAAACGILVGGSATVYNGTVLFCIVVLAFAAWNLRRRWLLSAIAVGAMLLPVIVLRVAGGAAYWAKMRGFSHTVDQGWFSEGPRIPWLYLWSADHLLLVLLLIGVWFGYRTRARECVWAAAAFYGLICLFSTGLNMFV